MHTGNILFRKDARKVEFTNEFQSFMSAFSMGGIYTFSLPEGGETCERQDERDRQKRKGLRGRDELPKIFPVFV